MVIFDLDGTLWNSSEVVAESWSMVIEEVVGPGKGLSPAAIASCMGMTMDEIADAHFGYLPKAERDALARKCETFENEYLMDHHGKLYDGVEEVLQELADSGVKMSVVSNCQKDYVKTFIESMDMSKYFVDYEEWGRTGLLKADNIRLVMERNGEDKAVYVGDIQKDSDAAHKAGIPCIYAAYGFGEISDAVATINSFRELPAVLKELGYM